MAIIYDEKSGIFFLHTKRTTYQMKPGRYGHLLHLYYGAATDEPMDGVIKLADRGFSGNPYEAGLDRTYSLDALPQELPTRGTGDFRSPLLSVIDERGVYGCDLRFDSFEICEGKYELPGLPAVFATEAAQTGAQVPGAESSKAPGADQAPGAETSKTGGADLLETLGPGATDRPQTLKILLRSRDPKIEVTLYYGVLPQLDVITRSAVVRNAGEATVTIDKAQTACLDFTEGDFDRIIFYGRHTMERIPDRQHLGHGATVIGSRRGFSSHQYNPMMILCDQEADEEHGRCWSMQFVYSGGFKAEIEKDQFDQTRMQMGLMEGRFSWPLKPGEELVLPEVILSFSGEGFGLLSQNLHQCIRHHVCRWPKGWTDSTSAKGVDAPDFQAPVLLNSWEACYFDFDGEKICRMAEDARDLGMDMVVLDDGWFGQRDDDLRALGDWTPNEQKLGCSLNELSDRIHGMGLLFGIWMEPEMVSEDSDLYRAHPDWALQVPGRDPVRSRNQLVLDLSREEVADNIYEQICAVLDSAQIEYLKWDANRHIADLYSVRMLEGTAEVVPSGMILHKYALGLYQILEKLRNRYPSLLIEGCCGGGGRFDAGMLYYTPQIWCSDNTDPIDRLTIQYGTSFGYPPEVMGAHVSASPNAETGRATPLETRAVVAMAGTFGYELDPAKISEKDKQTIRTQIPRFHEDRALIRTGKYYRLSDPTKDSLGAWMTVSEDGQRAIVSAVRTGVVQPLQGTEVVQPLQGRLWLRGLDADATYRIAETGERATGRQWMEEGMALEGMELELYAATYLHLEME
ncbi:MAG: alpha-galactosidase [Firmicutes bacterium]|nr:alpha-galactosidase [Bacillota bacterium]